MRTDVKKCGGCNRILSLRETCPTCSAKRREVLARAPAKSAPCPSPWENKAPPPFKLSPHDAPFFEGVDWGVFPESRYFPSGPAIGSPENPVKSFEEICRAETDRVRTPYGDFAAQNTARLKEDVACAVAGLNQSPVRILPLRRAEDYNEVCALAQAEGLLPAWRQFGTQGAVEITRPVEPFSPETFCPPGREALRRAGYECLTEARGGGLCARDRDGRAFYGEVPEDRLTGDQAERFLTFAWETMALDAGLDGILAIIEEEDEE